MCKCVYTFYGERTFFRKRYDIKRLIIVKTVLLKLNEPVDIHSEQILSQEESHQSGFPKRDQNWCKKKYISKYIQTNHRMVEGSITPEINTLAVLPNYILTITNKVQSFSDLVYTHTHTHTHTRQKCKHYHIIPAINTSHNKIHSCFDDTHNKVYLENDRLLKSL